jgi:hypothetical protein
MSSGTIPIADSSQLRPSASRERRLRIVLVLAAVVLLATAVLLAARSPGPAPAAANNTAGPVTEIVLDVSGSVGVSASDVAGRTLARLGRGGGRVGLILFSDVAQEALPRGTPASQLLPFARSFAPAKSEQRTLSVRRPPDFNPWHPSFSGGTKISAGLEAARSALQRDGVRGTAILISDLGDAVNDNPKVRRELLRLDQRGIGLKIIPLPNALPVDVRWFKRLTGPQGFVHPLPVAASRRPRTAREAGVSIALAAVAGLLALVLAAHELAARSLRWREPR